MTPDLVQLQTDIGYTFRDPHLLVAAITHPSYVAEQRTPVPDNQRLEFLGDAVLQLLLSDLLFRSYPAFDEGRLTKLRAALANENVLAGLARRLCLGPALLLGKGESASGGRDRNSNLADAFESLIGAVFLDAGQPATAAVCEPLFLPLLAATEQSLAWENPKGALQELTQDRFQITPSYEVVQVSGPDHSPEFVVRVSVAGKECGCATAGSRRTAEKRAAEVALRRLLDAGTDTQL